LSGKARETESQSGAKEKNALSKNFELIVGQNNFAWREIATFGSDEWDNRVLDFVMLRISAKSKKGAV
jgi:hypothetical protein